MTRRWTDPDRYRVEWWTVANGCGRLVRAESARTLAEARQLIGHGTADVYKVTPSGLWLVRAFVDGKESRV